MPHLIVQASTNVSIIQPDQLLKALNECLWQSGHFKQPQDIKARIVNVASSLVGIPEQEQQDGFIYVQLKLLSGRSENTKNDLAARLLACLKSQLAQTVSSSTMVQGCIEVVELSPIYHKAILSS